MKAPARSKTKALSVSLAVIAVAIAVILYSAFRRSGWLSSDDATIDADVVHIAPAVGGKIIKIAVVENARVSKGDILFQLDPVPYTLAVEQAEAELRLAQAVFETQGRVVATQRANALIAADQIRRAQSNYDLAVRTVERVRPLTSKGYAPEQELDQAEVAQRDAATSLRQAREQEAATLQAVDTQDAAAASIRARQAALAIARRALEDTTVQAPGDGLVAGLDVSAGEVIAPSQALFTLIRTNEWYAVANFRETDLDSIAIGDHATVYSMIDRRRPIHGVVEGMGWGVLTEDRINVPRSVPYVEPSLNWVRVARRFPVRIRLSDPPQQLMRLGASAVVEVQHGDRCN